MLPSSFAEPSVLSQAPSHSEVPLKEHILEEKMVALCQEAALQSGVPHHGPIFRAQTGPGTGTRSHYRSMRPLLYLSTDASASMEKAQLYSVEIVES